MTSFPALRRSAIVTDLATVSEAAGATGLSLFLFDTLDVDLDRLLTGIGGLKEQLGLGVSLIDSNLLVGVKINLEFFFGVQAHPCCLT